jgi:hypothetical protein
LDLASALVQVHDPGLFDRFIEIPFPSASRRPIPGLLDYMKSNTPALINWSLTAPKEAFLCQLRVGILTPNSLEADPLVNFIMTCLCADPNGLLRVSDLTNRVDSFFKEIGLPKLTPPVRRSVHIKIMSLLLKYFDTSVGAVRIGQARTIRGIRLLEPSDSSARHFALAIPSHDSMKVLDDATAKYSVFDFDELSDTGKTEIEIAERMRRMASLQPSFGPSMDSVIEEKLKSPRIPPLTPSRAGPQASSNVQILLLQLFATCLWPLFLTMVPL